MGRPPKRRSGCFLKESTRPNSEWSKVDRDRGGERMNGTEKDIQMDGKQWK